MRPNRWPAGDPQAVDQESTSRKLLPLFGIDENGIHHSDWAFTDVDAGPTKSFLVEKHTDERIIYYFDLAFSIRPEYEFFDVKEDPYCLTNLSGQPEYSGIEKEMKAELLLELKRSGDPRVNGPDTEVFESYIRYSPIRVFPNPENPE
jgi:uncharacterized sulfatase